ncbi:MAG TPA: molybdenum cofactor biosynthesis protein MoaE [Opitutaceae bacterium]|jgi:molybdopterin synthase catalytic subunit|nr:molybdenum cofactor biosynthesis protein MoaE [Opitutaceae bacterium]
MKFELTSSEITPTALLSALDDTAAGACVTFEGRVRSQNEGRAVLALEYEAYAPLAQKEGERILSEAAARFSVLGIACVHRTGRLVLGDLAVWVAVTSKHRAEAFEASRYVIDQVKARVPIWKKEHYSDGSTGWINCAPSGPAGPAPA